MSIFHKLFIGLCVLRCLAAGADEGVEIFADKLSTTFSAENTPLTTELQGSVKIRTGTMELTCDCAVLDHAKSEVTTLSPVVFRREGLVVRAKKLVYAFEAETGMFSEAEYEYLPYYGKSATVSRNKNTYVLSKGFITTCDRLAAPHYRVSCASIEIFPTMMRVKQIVVFLGNFPLFYFPVITQSLKANAKPSVEIIPGVHRKIKQGVFFIFNHPVGKDGNINRYEKFQIGSKGIGVGTGFEDLDHPHRRLDIFAGMEYGDDKVRAGAVAEFQKETSARGNFIADWRWMQDRNVLYDYFYKDFFEKERDYNYVSFTQVLPDDSFAGFLVAENAGDDFLQLEKLPEFFFSQPFFKAGPFFAGAEASLTRVLFAGDAYTRFSGDFSLRRPVAFPAGKVTPFVELKSVLYEHDGETSNNVVPVVGVKGEMLLTRSHGKWTEYLAPSVSVFARFPSEEDPKFVLEPADALSDGSFFGFGFDWQLRDRERRVARTRFRGSYDLAGGEFFDSTFDYDVALSRFLNISGQQLFNPSDGWMKENVNDLSVTLDRWYFSVGNRYVHDAFNGLTASAVTKFGEWEAGANIAYDLDLHTANRQEIFLTRRLHCLALRVSCVVGRETAFYISLMPWEFSKSGFVSRDSIE